MKNIIFIIVFLLLFFSSCTSDDNLNNNSSKVLGSIKGCVYNEFDQPLDDITVELVGGNKTQTDIYGNYYLQAGVGDQILSFYKENYLTQNKNVFIIKDSTHRVDINLMTGTPVIEVVDSIFELTSKVSSFFVDIKSNVDWTIKNEKSWYKGSINTGKGNGSIKIECEPNMGDSARTGYIFVESGSLQKKILVKQVAPIILKEIRGGIGNGHQNISDSIFLTFNQPVRINKIRALYERCLPVDMGYSLYNNNHSIRMSYNCAEMGGDFDFAINVDNGSETFSQTVTVPFYTKKYILEGYISSVTLVGNEEYCWISTTTPNRLCYYNIKEAKIERSLDLSFIPGKLAINPYNSKLYLIPNEYDNSIYILDSKGSRILETLKMNPDHINDHPTYPSIYPYDIAFTNNGFGVVLLTETNGSAMKWLMVESYKNNKISYLDQYQIKEGDSFDWVDYPNLKAVFTNYDGSKIIAQHKHNSTIYSIIDGTTRKLKKKEFDVTFASMPNDHIWASLSFIKPNRFCNKILFACTPMGQRIKNLDTDVDGYATFFDSRYLLSEFYSKNDNIVFYIEFNQLYIWDYDTNDAIRSANAIYGILDLYSLKNGKDLFFYKNNLNQNSSSLYLYNIDELL